MACNARCVVRNGTGESCCVRVSGEEHVMKPDDEISCSVDASNLSHFTAWYPSRASPNFHAFPANASAAIVELSPSMTSVASVGEAGTDDKQKLTFVNQCSVDIWFRLYLKDDDIKDRLVFAGETESYEFEDAHVTSFGAQFQFPPKNGVSDYRYIPIHEASIDAKDVNITFKPTIACKVLESTGEVSKCLVRNGTGESCCVRVSGEEHVMKPDDEISCSVDASNLSHFTAWYPSRAPPNFHAFPANASAAIVELSPSMTSVASVGEAGTDDKQKLTFVNQCSVDIWFRLYLKDDDIKDRLVFAGETESYEFEDAHVTSFGAQFQFPPKNGVSDYRYIPIHEASIDAKDVNITFKPTIACKVLESKPAEPTEHMQRVQDLFRKYVPRRCLQAVIYSLLRGSF